MELTQGYERTLAAAVELREEGIDVKITPSQSGSTEKPDGLPRDKWVIIEFFVMTPEQAAAVNKKADELGWSGIRFDASGHKGQRQWEVDYSFHITDTTGDDWETDRDQVEDMIDRPECGPDEGTQPA